MRRAQPTLPELQSYLNKNRALRAAVGTRADEPLELREFACGEYNANYAFEAAGRPLLLRVNLGSQMHLSNQIGYEAHALRALEPSGRTPHVWYVDEAAHCLVEDRLPGRPLRYETDLPEAACILADIHAVPGPFPSCLQEPSDPIGAILAECAAMFEVYRLWSQADRKVVAQIVALGQRVEHVVSSARGAGWGAPHLINTELNSGNFLIGEPGGRSYLIDWEKPLLGEVAQDLGHLLAPTTTFWKTDVLLKRDQAAAFVDLYERSVAGRFAVSGLAERVGVYSVATCLRGVTWCAMAYSQYVDDGRALTCPAVFAKIGSYLEPEFMSYVADEWCGSM